jgi:hypothetical protein
MTMIYQSAPPKNVGKSQQLGQSLKRKEQNVPFLMGSMNQNLRLCYTPKEYLAQCKEGTAVLRGAKIIVKCVSSANLEEV